MPARWKVARRISVTGPIISPRKPNSFNPTYMEINVGRGSRPMLVASTFGSRICRATTIME
ncbi:hypothetical protein D3C76_1846290 [compost metagenome]